MSLLSACSISPFPCTVAIVPLQVCGPREPIRIGPVRLEALYSVGPILEGIGINITAWSYEDELGVSLIGCPVSVPDPWVLVGHLHAALAELRAAVDRGIAVDR